jgi:hypothetical protein
VKVLKKHNQERTRVTPLIENEQDTHHGAQKCRKSKRSNPRTPS